VSKLTADSANNVVGEWYGYAQSTRWIESSNTQIYAGTDFDINKLSAENRQEWTYLNKTSSVAPTSVYYNVKPVASTSKLNVNNSSFTSYYIYDNAYAFNGQYWFPLD
jgi:hypothetical protein